MEENRTGKRGGRKKQIKFSVENSPLTDAFVRNNVVRVFVELSRKINYAHGVDYTFWEEPRIPCPIYTPRKDLKLYADTHPIYRKAVKKFVHHTLIGDKVSHNKKLFTRVYQPNYHLWLIYPNMPLINALIKFCWATPLLPLNRAMNSPNWDFLNTSDAPPFSPKEEFLKGRENTFLQNQLLWLNDMYW